MTLESYLCKIHQDFQCIFDSIPLSLHPYRNQEVMKVSYTDVWSLGSVVHVHVAVESRKFVCVTLTCRNLRRAVPGRHEKTEYARARVLVLELEACSRWRNKLSRSYQILVTSRTNEEIWRLRRLVDSNPLYLLQRSPKRVQRMWGAPKIISDRFP